MAELPPHDPREQAVYDRFSPENVASTERSKDANRQQRAAALDHAFLTDLNTFDRMFAWMYAEDEGVAFYLSNRALARGLVGTQEKR